jgi:hypothetical protein
MTTADVIAFVLFIIHVGFWFCRGGNGKPRQSAQLDTSMQELEWGGYTDEQTRALNSSSYWALRPRPC